MAKSPFSDKPPSSATLKKAERDFGGPNMVERALRSIAAFEAGMMAAAFALLAGVHNMPPGTDAFARTFASILYILPVLSIASGLAILWANAQIHSIAMATAAIPIMPGAKPITEDDAARIIDAQNQIGRRRSFLVWSQIFLLTVSVCFYSVGALARIWG